MENFSIYQENITTGDHYVLSIVCDGAYSEIDTITHMHKLPGDPPHVRVFEAMSYADYDDIPIGRFNIGWNDMERVIRGGDDYIEITNANYNWFHQALMMIILSFFFPVSLFYPARLRQDPQAADISAQPFFFRQEHERIEELIYTFGRSVNCYAKVWNEMYIPDLGYHAYSQIISHNNN